MEARFDWLGRHHTRRRLAPAHGDPAPRFLFPAAARPYRGQGLTPGLPTHGARVRAAPGGAVLWAHVQRAQLC